MEVLIILETNQLLINYYKKEEIEKYFIRVPNRKRKEYIISILENTKDI